MTLQRDIEHAEQIKHMIALPAFQSMMDEFSEDAETARTRLVFADVETPEGRKDFREAQVEARALDLLNMKLQEYVNRGNEAAQQLDESHGVL